MSDPQAPRFGWVQLPSDWPKGAATTKRTVAIFDVLGFRRLVATLPLKQLAERYEAALAHTEYELRVPPAETEGGPSVLIRGRRPGEPLCDRYVFSDTILLVSSGESADATLKLLVYAWRMFQWFLASQLPLRGAVATGEFFENPRMSAFLGSALAAAYGLEQSQDWIGAAISPSVWTAFPELLQLFCAPNPLLDIVFREYDVPMKNDTTCRLRTLNWRFNLVHERGTRDLLGTSEEPGARRKIENAMDYARAIRRDGKTYGHPVPFEFQRIYVGDRQPPFPHGDDL